MLGTTWAVSPTVLWFRRDLRLRDLPTMSGLWVMRRVLALLCAPTRLESSSGPRRLQFRGLVAEIDAALVGRLLILRTPVDVIPTIYASVPARYTSRADFSPLGVRRDRAVVAPSRWALEAGGDGIAVSGVTGAGHQGRRQSLQGLHTVLQALARGRLAGPAKSDPRCTWSVRPVSQACPAGPTPQIPA